MKRGRDAAFGGIGKGHAEGRGLGKQTEEQTIDCDYRVFRKATRSALC